MRSPFLFSALFLAASATFHPAAAAPLYQTPGAPLEQRVSDLFERLTPEEKLSLLSGTGFATPAIPRLGVPPMEMVDAPQGVRGGDKGTQGPATLFPSGVAMGATWNPALIERIGHALGVETQNKGTGAAVLLGPCVGIHRSPQGGRNTESFGEDPFHSGQLAAAYIKGVQGTGAAACVKHYNMNEQETGRTKIDVRIGERALREIYLPPFEAAVKEGGVWSVMSSYNQVNGEYATANSRLLTDILKEEWSFDGVVMSDWGAVHETIGAVNAGNDLEMPGGKFLTVLKLEAGLEAGHIRQASIDDSARRILRMILRTGLLDGPRKPDSSLVNSHEHQKLAYDAACEAVVLLKNQPVRADVRRLPLLPLDAAKLKSIAVIGPAADPLQTGGRWSADVRPFYTVSGLKGIRELVGGRVKVDHVPGVSLEGEVLPPIPPAVLAPPDAKPGEHGLRAEYFANRTFAGTPSLTRVDPQLDFDFKNTAPAPGIPAENFSVRWIGTLTPPQPDHYILGLTSDDGSRLYIDGQLVIDNGGNHGARTLTREIGLEAARSYPIRVEYDQAGGDAVMRLGWSFGSRQDDGIRKASEAARNADVAIVFAGVGSDFEGEGFDRASLDLPGGQNELIQAVAAANSRTVVVLDSGTPVLMNAWIDEVPAVLQAWYTGQEAGRAIADILFGKVNPSGKLPDTYAVKREDYPDFPNFPGNGTTVDYLEGIWVGHRHFDRENIAPLFPFGHGLSYTTFTYDDLKITPPQKPGGDARVSLRVTNSGRRAGKEVVQLYVAPPKGDAERPVRELKGFEKIDLQPDQSKTIEFTLPPRAFACYDVGARDWSVPPGAYSIEIGSSSRDIRLQGTLDIPATPGEARKDPPIWGTFTGNQLDGILDHEKWLGRQTEAVLVYTGDANWADYDGSIGWAMGIWSKIDRRVLWSIPLIPKGATLAAAAAGAFNDHYRRIADKLAKWRREEPVLYIRTGWEFNGGWFHYNAIGKEKEFIGAWRQFVTTFRSVSDRFRFDWCPSAATAAEAKMNPEDAYPGDDYVDVIGLDVYDETRWCKIEDPVTRWKTHTMKKGYGLEWHRDFARKHKKPMSYPEWGGGGNEAGDNPYFIEQMHKWFVKNNVVYATYWDSNSVYKGKLSTGAYPRAAEKYKELFTSRETPDSPGETPDSAGEDDP